jgi:hypothetical protein
VTGLTCIPSLAAGLKLIWAPCMAKGHLNTVRKRLVSAQWAAASLEGNAFNQTANPFQPT